LGTGHPYLANSLHNLATLYIEQGRYREAAPLPKRALAIREAALGPVHPDLARSLATSATVLKMTGRADEAEKLSARATSMQRKLASEDR